MEMWGVEYKKMVGDLPIKPRGEEAAKDVEEKYISKP